VSEDEISDSEAAGPDTVIERRAVSDRRRLSLRTFVQSGLTPRRRGGRRDGEHEHLIDWHEPDLLFLALAILLLSVTDAFFTLTLMTRGAEEANPLLAYDLQRYPGVFAALKMVLTGGGVLVLVAMARARVFRIVRVRTDLQCFLSGYVVLVGYEMWMLKIVL
jgi:hypothetical protein